MGTEENVYIIPSANEAINVSFVVHSGRDDEITRGGSRLGLLLSHLVLVSPLRGSLVELDNRCANPAIPW